MPIERWVDLNPLNFDEFGRVASKNSFDADGFARQRWKFDEDGFAKARASALDAARDALVNAMHDENAKVYLENHPSALARSVDGVDGASDDAIKL
jgi:hypothetical protein